MADGLCSHQLFLSDDYIVASCSKMFEDGSARKVRVLSTTATDGSGHPVVIAEQSTPQYEGVMVSPLDSMHVLHHSATETDVMYAVGSTIVEVKLVADASNVAWRTTINIANLCDDVGMLRLDGTDSILVVSAHGKSYFLHKCGYHQQLSPQGECQYLDAGFYQVDNMIHDCSVPGQNVTSWHQHIQKLACKTQEQGSAGESLLQVDEYASVIIPLKDTCPWLVQKVEEKEIEVKLEEQIEEEESVLRVIEDKPIFNDVPSMPDNWYWRDKPLHKNTIKQGQKYWVD